MRSFALAAFVAAVSANSEIESAFLGYITEFAKSYASVEEYGFRLSQFTRAHLNIVEHNATESSFKMAHNNMSDWTEAEYKAILTHSAMPEHAKNYQYHPEVAATYSPIDWVSLGYVNAVKDQGQCGSCWSFSANCALETEWAIKYGTLYSLSEQELVSCDTSCYGCNGGW
jgi:cathepsin L